MAKKGLSTQMWLMIVALVLLMVILLIMVMKNKEPVYLKPKGSPSNNSTEPSNNPKEPITPDDSVSDTQQTAHTDVPSTIHTNPTTAYADDSVIQSDLKNIRQSAVKMSVGQKQGASQIVKDWLDDGGDNSDDQTDNKQEENEE